MLDQHPVPNLEEIENADIDPATGRRHVSKRTCMGRLHPQSNQDLLALGNKILEGQLHIRESRQQGVMQLCDPLWTPDFEGQTGIVADEIRRNMSPHPLCIALQKGLKIIATQLLI